MDDAPLPVVPTAHGFYPAIGTVVTGSRIAFGGGWRRDAAEPGSFVDLKGLWSIANYKRFEATGVSAAHGRFDLGGRIGWFDGPRLAYFGLGAQSAREARVSFRLKETYIAGAVVMRVAPWLQARAGVGYDGYVQDEGRGRYPSIEEHFTTRSAPRLGENLAFVTAAGSATFMWLPSPGYSRDGGLYRIGIQTYTQTGSSSPADLAVAGVESTTPGRGTFAIVSHEIVQHLPMRNGKSVLSLRGRTESIVGSSAAAPYFLLPSLGGGTTLRGYLTDRFRDAHSLMITAEWRWLVKPKFLDVAVFSDAGTVGPHLSRLPFRHMSIDYGVGARFHSKLATILRADLVHGSEGFGLVLTATPPF